MRIGREAQAGLRSGSSSPRRSPAPPPRLSADGSELTLPGGVGIGARQELHHGEQMAEMFAVVALPAPQDGPLVGRRLELRVRENGCDRGAIFLFKLTRIHRDASVDCCLQGLIDLE